MPQVLIADDHGLYRKGLRVALESAFPDMEVLEADCLDEALAQLEKNPGADMALIDLHMPGVTSLGNLKTARELYPQLRFVIISASDSRTDVLSVLAAGLHGFISKKQPDSEVLRGIGDVLSGRIYVPPSLADPVPVRAAAVPGERRVKASSGVAELPRLTVRQRDVLDLIAHGLSNKEIARKLEIAEATTKIHAAAVMRLLGVRNRTEAALIARNGVAPNAVLSMAGDGEH